MALPREHRDGIEALARQWVGLNARVRRGERLNRLASVLILVCGGALLAFPEYLSSEAELVVPPTGAFLWGGWYKMYRVGRNRREARAEATDIEQRLKEYCGPAAEFAGNGAEIARASETLDPFGDGNYA